MMARSFCFALGLVSFLAIAACNDSTSEQGAGGSEEETSSGDSSGDDSSQASGAGQKGPFQVGASVQAVRLNSDGSASSDSVSAQVNANGAFSLSNLPWRGATSLTVTGHHFNELTGSFSSQKRSLRSIIDPTASVSSNVNLYTHILAARTEYLMGQGKTLSNARKTGLSDLKALTGVGTEPGSLNLADTSKLSEPGDSANLLRFSASLLKAALDQAELNALAADFGDDGQMNGSATATGDGKSAWEAVQLASAQNSDLLKTARSTLQSQYGTTPPKPNQNTGGDHAWIPDACTQAKLTHSRVICNDETYSSNTSTLGNKLIRVVPEATGYYTLSVNFQSGGNGRIDDSWYLHNYKDRVGEEHSSGDSDNRTGVAEDVTEKVLFGGDHYFLQPWWATGRNGGDPADFTAHVEQVSEGASHSPVELPVGESYAGRVGVLLGESNVSYYRFEPQKGGEVTVTATDQDVSGDLWVGVYKDDNDDGRVEASVSGGNSLINVSETEVERARDELETADEQSRPGDVHVVQADLNSQTTYFLVIENRSSLLTQSRPAPSYDSIDIMVEE